MAKVKKPRITISMQLNFKDSPALYRGTIQENWVIGKDKPSSAAALAFMAVKTILRFYVQCFQTDISEEIQALAEYITDLKVVENEQT